MFLNVIVINQITQIKKQYKSLIDTGAAKTFISEKIVSELNLQISNAAIYSDVSGNDIKTNLYECFFILENHTKLCKIEVATIKNRDDFDNILGIDLLSNGELKMKNNEFTFIVESLI